MPLHGQLFHILIVDHQGLHMFDLLRLTSATSLLSPQHGSACHWTSSEVSSAQDITHTPLLLRLELLRANGSLE